MGKITLLMPGVPPRDIALDKPRITLGRRPHNDICIDDPAVSSEHAVILRVGKDAVLEDLDSTNGTRVSGQPVRKHFLQDGDVIEVAKFRLVYHSAEAPPQPRPAVPILEVVNGTNAGKRCAIARPISVIGGLGDSTLIILRRGADYYLLVDGEDDFARVNGTAVQSDVCRLHDRDLIRIADVELQFFYPAAGVA